jgi:hypothetical protein
MKYFIVLFIILTACGGKLTDEERQRLHEGMATQDIRRVSEADLQEAAMAYARSVMQYVMKANNHLSEKSRIDSLAAAHHVRIYFLMPDDDSLGDTEKKLVEAYIAGSDTGSAGENLQKIGEDSILYTMPVFKVLPGSQSFSHAIGIKMAKKTIVLSIPTP